MDEINDHPHPPCCAATSEEIARRGFLTKISIALGGLCAAMLGLPLVGFIIAPLFRKITDTWVAVGKIEDFEIGKTIQVPFADPSPLPWAGITAKGAAWLRRQGDGQFIAFSVNCTHMGCPVRWLSDAKLFMCPCHGGVYYSDGSVAGGPPPNPLVRYQVRVANGLVEIKAAGVAITTTL
jgi:menaquinol-cytochrome c reductase iron-sulfur subunit